MNNEDIKKTGNSQVSNAAAMISASLLAQLGTVFAQANVCSSGIYRDLAPLSGLVVVQAYCTANFPRAPTTSTTTITSTKSGVSTSTVTSTTTATNFVTQTAYSTETDATSVASTTTITSNSITATTTTITNTQVVTTTVAYGGGNNKRAASSSSVAGSSPVPAVPSTTSRSSSAASSTTLKTSGTPSSTASAKSAGTSTAASSTELSVSATARASSASSKTTSTTSSSGNVLASLVGQAKDVISTYCSCIEAPKSTIVTVTNIASTNSVLLVTVTATVSVAQTSSITDVISITQTQTYPVTITQTSISTSVVTETTSTVSTTTSQCPQASPAYSQSLGCVDTNNDKNNCGSIGNECPASQYFCSQGTCSAPNACQVGVAGCKPSISDCGCYRTAEGAGYCAHQTADSLGPSCMSSSDCGNGLACLTDLNGPNQLPGFCAQAQDLQCSSTAASRLLTRSLFGRMAQQKKQTPADNLRKKANVDQEGSE